MAAGAYAQGQLYWIDGQRGFTVAILSPDPANSAVEDTGNTVYDVPSGSATYGGGWIGGAAAPGGGVGATPANGPAGYNYQLNNNFEVGLYVDTSQAALTADILTGTPLATAGILGGASAGLYTLQCRSLPFRPLRPARRFTSGSRLGTLFMAPMSTVWRLPSSGIRMDTLSQPRPWRLARQARQRVWPESDSQVSAWSFQSRARLFLASLEHQSS